MEHRYRGAPASTLLTVPLDDFTAAYHRPSGTTHLLASPAPEILAALDGRTLTAAALLALLHDRYRLADADPAALAARLAELAAIGLVAVV